MGTHRVRFTKVTASASKTQTKWDHEDFRSPSLKDAALVVEWLNASKGTAAYRRVLALHAELEALRAELDKPFPGIEWETADRPTAQSAKDLQRMNEFTERHNRLNALLGKFTFRIGMAFNTSSHRWSPTMISKDSRGPHIEIENSVQSRIRVGEGWVVAALTRLSASRDLGKVHLCDDCHERWHRSIRTMDRFCSDECRDHFHTRSDAYRERKRESQRAYRNSEGYKKGIK